MKKILTSGLVSLIAVTTFSFATTSFVHASDYVSGLPAFLKNKTWQSGYAKFVGKGPGSEAAKTRTTFVAKNNKIATVNDLIYEGKHSTYKTNNTILKYKQLGNNKYHLIVKGVYTNGTYTVKVIDKNHIKMDLTQGITQSYYAK